MKGTVSVKATKNCEPGVTPSAKMLTGMGAFSGELTPELRAQCDCLCLEVEVTT